MYRNLYIYSRSKVVNRLRQKWFSRLSYAGKKVLIENDRFYPDLDIFIIVKM